ncbi:hypothetical protein BD309DRAFT_964577 [Dichomitus squalens]|nr:hypothetical protein BD309DRAFT_964577 [Dichomitus squalens]
MDAAIARKRVSHILDLPFDTLYNLITFVPQWDLSRLARTCRHLLQALNAELIRRPCVRYGRLPLVHY